MAALTFGGLLVAVKVDSPGVSSHWLFLTRACDGCCALGARQLSISASVGLEGLDLTRLDRTLFRSEMLLEAAEFLSLRTIASSASRLLRLVGVPPLSSGRAEP